MHIHIIIYSVSPEVDILIRLNTKLYAESVLSYCFPINSLCCDCMKRIVSGEAQSRRGNLHPLHCGETLGLYKILNKLTCELNLRSFIPPNECWQASRCQKILIRKNNSD